MEVSPFKTRSSGLLHDIISYEIASVLNLIWLNPRISFGGPSIILIEKSSSLIEESNIIFVFRLSP